MNITYSLVTKMATGVDRLPQVTEGEVNVPFDEMHKLIEKVVGHKPVLDKETGLPLYKIPTEKEGEYITTTESMKEIDGQEVELEPLMEEQKRMKRVTVTLNPEMFSLGEILHKKYLDILNDSEKESIIADVFLDETDLDLADENHSADTGLGILILHPNGQAKTNSIALNKSIDSFSVLEFDADQGIDMYISGTKFEDGKADIGREVSNVTIKFVNTTNKPKRVRAYALGY